MARFGHVSSENSPFFFLSFFFPFFLFYHFLFAHSPSLSLFFFFSLSVSLSVFFFSPPRPLPLRSATTVEFGLAREFSLTDEVVAVEIWRSLILISLCFFFFFDYGFHVIVIMGCAVYGGVLLKILSFFFFWVWFLDLEFIRGSMIVVVVCGSDCWFLDGGDCH